MLAALLHCASSQAAGAGLFGGAGPGVFGGGSTAATATTLPTPAPSFFGSEQSRATTAGASIPSGGGFGSGFGLGAQPQVGHPVVCTCSSQLCACCEHAGCSKVMQCVVSDRARGAASVRPHPLVSVELLCATSLMLLCSLPAGAKHGWVWCRWWIQCI